MTRLTHTQEIADLRLQLAEAERKINAQADAMKKAAHAHERGEDLTRHMHALMQLAAVNARWDADAVIERILLWVDLYGEPPTSTDWNPGKAKSIGRDDMVRTYLEGDWPHASTAQRIFGTWNKAIIAAGQNPLTRADGNGRRMRPDSPHGNAHWPVWTGWEYARWARERTGLTQGEIAARAHLSMTWISRMENGKDLNVGVRPLLAYANAVDLRPGALIEGQE